MAPGLPPPLQTKESEEVIEERTEPSQECICHNPIHCTNAKCLEDWEKGTNLSWWDNVVCSRKSYVIGAVLIASVVLATWFDAPQWLVAIVFVPTIPFIFYSCRLIPCMLLGFFFCIFFDALKYHEEIWMYLKQTWAMCFHNFLVHHNK